MADQSKKQCAICQEERPEEGGGLRCPNGHFVCADSHCFDGLLGLHSTPLSINKNGSTIPCPVPDCTTKWEFDVIVQNLPLRDRPQARQYLQAVAARSSEERPESAATSASSQPGASQAAESESEDEKIEKTVRHILSEIVTLRRPCCDAPVDAQTWDGCPSVGCDVCGQDFCGVCLAFSGENAHPHVNSVHPDMALGNHNKVRKLHDQMRLTLVMNYIRTDPWMKTHRSELLKRVSEALAPPPGSDGQAEAQADHHAPDPDLDGGDLWGMDPWDEADEEGEEGREGGPVDEDDELDQILQDEIVRQLREERGRGRRRREEERQAEEEMIKEEEEIEAEEERRREQEEQREEEDRMIEEQEARAEEARWMEQVRMEEEAREEEARWRERQRQEDENMMRMEQEAREDEARWREQEEEENRRGHLAEAMWREQRMREENNRMIEEQEERWRLWEQEREAEERWREDEEENMREEEERVRQEEQERWREEEEERLRQAEEDEYADEDDDDDHAAYYHPRHADGNPYAAAMDGYEDDFSYGQVDEDEDEDDPMG